ncbi:transcriptional regulator [Rhodococcus sp. 05-2256-B2]|uniref:Mu transposase domain-containing protein n=2 Tax=Rhodococcus TaxID=1827 RepID=UPI000B9AC770|nr:MULTISPECIES: DDE-type integrase/transposase/recombinase [unclassified Rhodococcus (in: high G+C Gram-positive bacteria)]OZD83117.1 transcriptional regulator [Rhodococcus sp. 05-2256-B4]OZD91507.1 transcriptional regulator [Rhodococcus sp. 05-2256-B3]OZD97245.1 transcriptional regulator [Rhodococcus sp. 05-2256-B1]OZD99876.1 transcriptional regulator [Rhodococcus sp. 05-2256-B2]
MLTREEDVEIHALHQRGWKIADIARHTGRDRKTIRSYLNGTTTPGVRKRSIPDPFEVFLAYVIARLSEDPHLWVRTLCDELEDLGYAMSYQTLHRKIRVLKLRPICKACLTATERPNAVIDHPPGEETQWDWVDLPNPPASWGWGSMAHLFVGTLACSGKWRGVLAPNMTQPHVVDGLDRICRGLGGVSRVWRFDRMATVCHPDSGRITASFAGIAKYYGVSVAICPPRRGNRKGAVEKSNHTAAQRWWRAVADDLTVEQAQASLDRFCSLRSDTRLRPTKDGKASVATIATTEGLHPMPAAAYPAILTTDRVVSRQALVSYRGNRYSVPPELACAAVTVTHVLGSDVIDIVTTSGITIARHRLAADGTGAMVRDHGHIYALEQAAMAGANTGRPHRRKERIPPGPDALAAAEKLRTSAESTLSSRDGRRESGSHAAKSTDTGAVVYDLSIYERAAHGRNTL